MLPLEGTYLAWLDIRRTGMDGKTYAERLLREARVAVNAGSMYGEAGRDYIRLNLACPRAHLEEALRRIADCS